MPISEPYELDGVTVGSTELSIVSGTTTLQTIADDGVYQLWLDPVGAAVAKGDEFRVRIYEKVISSGTKRVVFSATISDAQAEVWTFPPLMLLHGWDMTIQKIAGTDRAWDASIRKAAGATIAEYDSMSAVTVGTTELSVISGTTTLQTVTDDGFYQLWVDPVTNMAKVDDFHLRIYETVEGTGGAKRQVLKSNVQDAQNELWVSPFLCLINGWDMTIQRVAGADRAFDASVRRIS